MLKTAVKGLGVALSVLSVGTMASAGSLAEGLADPKVEDLVVEEGDRGLGIWPIVGLIVVGAIILNSGGDDEPVSKSAPPEM